MVLSDLYIHGPQAQREGIKKMVIDLALHIGVQTENESTLNIPIGMLMQVLVGNPIHSGLIVGMNTEDPECVVLRIENPDIIPVCEALLECFNGIEIETDEDVSDVPWPFE